MPPAVCRVRSLTVYIIPLSPKKSTKMRQKRKLFLLWGRHCPETVRRNMKADQFPLRLRIPAPAPLSTAAGHVRLKQGQLILAPPGVISGNERPEGLRCVCKPHQTVHRDKSFFKNRRQIFRRSYVPERPVPVPLRRKSRVHAGMTASAKIDPAHETKHRPLILARRVKPVPQRHPQPPPADAPRQPQPYRGPYPFSLHTARPRFSHASSWLRRPAPVPGSAPRIQRSTASRRRAH